MKGVWIVYYSDMSGIWVFGTEIEALRCAVEKTASIKFMEFGVEFRESLR